MNHLDSAETFLDLMIEKLPIGVLVVNQEKKIRRINPKLLKMVGMATDTELVGKSCDTLFCPDAQKGCPVLDRKIALESSETVLTHTSGRNLPVRRKIIQTRFMDETIIIELYEDLSPLKKARQAYRESKSRLLTFVEACTDPILIYGLEGDVVYANPAFENTFGWTLNDLKRPGTFIPANQEDELECQLTRVAEGSRCLGLQTLLNTRDGRTLDVCINAAPLTGDAGEPSGKILFLHPETSDSGLPSSPLKIFSDALSCRNTPQEHQEQEGIIELRGMVVHENGPQSIDFDLRTTLDEIRETYAIKCAQKGLEFDISVHQFVPSLIKGDPGRLRQVLINLLSTALNATRAGEIRIDVVLEQEDKENALIRFELSDTGSHGPPGQGQTISGQLIELMKGTVDSHLNNTGGYDVTFKIPFEKQPPKDIQVPIQTPGRLNASEDKKILIVDDHAAAVPVKEAALLWSNDVETVHPLSEALTLLQRARDDGRPFDFVILDMEIAIQKEGGLADTIKTDPALRDTRIIILSAMGRRGDIDRLQSIGATAYLPKPVDPKQLYDCLNQAFYQAKDADVPIITRYSLKEGKKHRIRILLADHNLVSRKLMINILSKSGYTVDAVQDGPQAVRAFENQAYDIIFLDTRMPEVTGYEAAAAIRELENQAHASRTPIIAIAENVEDRRRKKCIEMGMDDYISKPVMPMILLEKVEKWTWKNPNTAFQYHN